MLTIFFIFANFSQFFCHKILYHAKKKSNYHLSNPHSPLRSPPNEQPNREEYVLPRGFLFEWVSCPHYFLEVVVYILIALSLPLSLSACLVAMWVALNLSVVAYRHHLYYLERFSREIFERDRKSFFQWRVLVPGVW
jgi:hypothetical protein